MFVPIFLRAFNNFDSYAVSDETGLFCPEPTLAVQDQADECDINFIVAKFGITGMLPVALKPPVYGDFTGVSDYRSALSVVRAADDAFMQMPAVIRSRFENDPQKFVEFCSDVVNHDEMGRMGLLIPGYKPSEASSTLPASPASTVPSP